MAINALTNYFKYYLVDFNSNIKEEKIIKIKFIIFDLNNQDKNCSPCVYTNLESGFISFIS